MSFDFSTVPGYLLRYDPSVGIFTDAARTTPVSADGNVVGGIEDQSGNGYHAEQATTGNKPIYKTNIANGKPAIRMAVDEFMSIPNLLARTDTEGAIYAVFITRGAGGSGSHSFLTSADVGSSNRFWWTEIRGDKLSVTQNNALGNNIVLGKTTIQTGDTHIGAWRSSGTAYSYALDGAAELLTVSSGANNGNWIGDTDARDNAQMGVLTYGGGPLAYANLDLLYLVVYSLKPSAGDEANIHAELASLFGRSLVTKSVVCDGDSLTAGSGGTSSYPSQLVALLGSGWRRLNFGVASQQLTAMSSDATTQIDPNYNSNLARNVLCAWGGTNDLLFGASAATTQTRYQSYCSGRRTAGYYVVAFTILPRSGGGTPGTFEADRQTFNTWLRANYTSFADALVDVAADSRIGDAGDETDTTYYSGDNVHLNNAGYAIVASLAAAVIQPGKPAHMQYYRRLRV